MFQSKRPQFMRGKSVSTVMGMVALPKPPQRKTDRSVSFNEFRLQSLNSIREVYLHPNNIWTQEHSYNLVWLLWFASLLIFPRLRQSSHNMWGKSQTPQRWGWQLCQSLKRGRLTGPCHARSSGCSHWIASERYADYYFLWKNIMPSYSKWMGTYMAFI